MGRFFLVYLYSLGAFLDWIFPPTKGRAFWKTKSPPLPQHKVLPWAGIMFFEMPQLFFFFFSYDTSGYYGKNGNKWCLIELFWHLIGMWLNGKTTQPIYGPTYGVVIDVCLVGNMVFIHNMMSPYMAQWFMLSSDQSWLVIDFFS